MKFLYFFLATLPLVILPGGNQTFEMAKFVWLLLGVGGIALFRGYEIYHQGFSWDWVKGKRLWWALFLVYGVYLLVNTIMALSPEVSFWGGYVRHGGLLTLGSLMILMVLLISRGISANERERIVKSLFFGGSIVAFLALVQYVLLWIPGNMLPGFLRTNIALLHTVNDRVFATMGHPNFLGQYLLGTILLGIGYRLLMKRSMGYFAIQLFLQLGALLLTWNRASFIGVLLGGMALFVCYAWWSGQRREKILASVGIALVLLGTLGYLLFALQRSDERSLSTREVLFPKVVELIGHQMVLGSGLDSFGAAFSPYISKEIYRYEQLTHLPDKAHNEILDILVEQGIVGMFFILILGILLVFEIWRKRLSQEGREALIYLIAILGMEISFLAGFATTVHRVLIAVLILLILVTLSEGSEKDKDRKSSNVHVYTIAMLLVFLFGLTGVYLGLGFASADITYKIAYDKHSSSLYQLALHLSPFPYEFALFGNKLLDNQYQRLELLESAYVTSPSDVYTSLFLARWYGEEKSIQKMEDFLLRAKATCTSCSEVYYYGAVNFAQLGEQRKASEYASAFLDLLPSFVLQGDDLSSFEQERRRIILKEQGDRIQLMQEIAAS